MSPPLAQSPQVIAQFRAIIWHALDNELLASALFTAERLHAYDPKGADSVHLFALCLMRDGQYRAAETLTKSWLRHVGCAYIYAQCCLRNGGGKESQGITALEGCKRLWNNTSAWNQHTDGDRRTLPDAAAILCLIGKLWLSLNEAKKAVDSFVAAVKLNPFLWEAFTGLCDTGTEDMIDHALRHGNVLQTNPDATGVNLRVNNIFKQTQEMIESLKIPPPDPAMKSEGGLRRNASENIQHDPFASAAPQPRDRSDLAYNNHPSFFNRLNEGVGAGSGNIPELETPTAQSSNSSGTDMMGGGLHGAPEKPPPVRKTRAATSNLHSRKLASRTTRDMSNDGKRSTSATADPSAPQPQRRSNRLNAIKGLTSKHSGSERETRLSASEREREREARKARAAGSRSRSLQVSGNAAAGKEREKDKGTNEDVNVRSTACSKSSLPPPPLPRRETRSTTAQAPVAGPGNAKRKATAELTRPAKKQMSDAPAKPPPPAAPAISKPQIDPKKEEAQLYILDLYRKLGTGYFCLNKFQGQESLQALTALPPYQRDTPWVQAQMGRAHYEMANYAEAEKYFLKVRQLDPGRTRDMEVFSTILWHQRKDVELSYLAHELIELDRTAPAAWCALGNCFSLGRDHDQALKCFKRATQLNPKLAYAFTLQGHEHVSNEEYEKALVSYRSAITADSRHYNAWYGLGKVYEKMGKYEVAEKHFRSAAKINPTNAVLVCCVGMVLEKLKNLPGALNMYNQACKMQPKSALSRFKKARTLMAMQNYQGALDELTVLKDLAPDEANVHFLLGRLYKALKDKTSAIKHLTIALNLDPKAGHLIKEVIENLDDEDENYNGAEDSEVYRLLDADP